MEKSILKFIWEHKKTLNTQNDPKQKEQHWRYHNTRLQTILQSHGNKNSQVDQWNRSSRNKTTQLWPADIWQKHHKPMLGKDSLFNQCCWGNWISTCRRLKLDPSLTLYNQF
jgi:hypothetical protein